MQYVQEDLLKPPAGVLGGLWLPPPSSSEVEPKGGIKYGTTEPLSARILELLHG